MDYWNILEQADYKLCMVAVTHFPFLIGPQVHIGDLGVSDLICFEYAATVTAKDGGKLPAASAAADPADTNCTRQQRQQERRNIFSPSR